MERHPRRNADLEVPPSLARLIGALRARAGLEGPVELDVDHVRDVEAGVGCLVPDVVLALIAADIPDLRDDLNIRLDQVMKHAAAAREAGARGDFVAIGAEGRDAFHGFATGRDADRIHRFDVRSRSLDSWPLEIWLARQCGVDDPATFADVGPPAGLRLVRTHEAAGAPDTALRVQHHKWGEGIVLAQHGEGPTRKVKVEFPGLGLRVVQARFLQFPDD